MSKTDYQVICVHQNRWQMLVENAFSRLSEEEWPLAEAILTTLHDQHIGVTPALVVSLVKTFWSTGAETSVSPIMSKPTESPWAEVCDCLVRAVAPLDKLTPGYIQAERFRLVHFLRHSPLYVITRLVAPLIAYACQQIGLCYLFSHQDERTPVNAKKYEEYHHRLIAAIKHIAQEQKSGANPYELFWQDIAYMLTQEQSFSLPEADPPTAALFYRLNELPEWADDQTLRRLHTLVTPLRTRHRQEGGVRGIRVSRRLEDIHDILLSEFMNPEPLLVDRLLNSGYLVFEREPKREKLRDMLLMGIMPDCVRRQANEALQQSQLSADFAKVCWFNFAAHLGLLLRRYSLWQSEFRWIEGDAWQRIRVESRILLEMELDKRRVDDIILDKTGDSRHQRHHFLDKLHWLPNYLDTHARYEPLKGWNDPPANDSRHTALEEDQSPEKQQLHKLVEWVRLVKAQQKDNPDWPKFQAKFSRRQAAQARPQKLAADGYTFVHIMIFLPADCREAWKKNGVSGMLNVAAQIRRDDPQCNLSIVWTPSLIMPPKRPDDQQEAKEKESSWMYAAPYHPDVSPFRRQPSDPVEVADALVTTWLDEIMREIKHA